ncbi:MAG: hypothetical protein HGA78_04400 [Nitrospirales bacterium]|nr:hypothetical protein [Nitrospirales bacterium]
MKKVLAMTAVMVFGVASLSMAAGWDKCKGCHTDAGKPGISKADMLKKYKSADELVKGAKANTSPMMKSVNADEAGLKAAAAELGLK